MLKSHEIEAVFSVNCQAEIAAISHATKNTRLMRTGTRAEGCIQRNMQRGIRMVRRQKAVIFRFFCLTVFKNRFGMLY